MSKCRWVVREGTSDSYWAFTPCKKGFNYLSKVNRVEEIETAYEGRECPICGKSIYIVLDLVKGGNV